MRHFVCAVAATAFAFVACDVAQADAEAGQGYLTIMGTYLDDDKSRGLDDAVNGGMLGVGYGLSDAWNVEGYIGLAYPNQSSPGSAEERHQALGLDFQRVFMRSGRFSPYLLAGLGNFNRQLDTDETDGLMLAWGGGFYLDLFSSNVSLRGEAKRRLDNSANDGGRYDNLFSLGLHMPFGAATPRWVDSDGDGVEDGSDRCPNTPAGAKVDAYGCELDSDGDGVKDSKDKCPGTPRGVMVDADGCPNDSDGDGVTDDKDKCPNTPAGQPVDAMGCELDDDGDGVVNRLDQCPGTPAGVQVDIKGCEIKAVIRLEGVNFETNPDRLLDTAYGRLNDAAATLLKNPTIEVEVAGHTDSDGAAEYNEGLSQRRAQTVHDYLASKGVEESRMTVRGYGESQPIADNATRAGKAQNRRVELRITER